MAVKKAKTFEESLAALEVIVSQLERADIPLEEALKQFQVGIELSQQCKAFLDNAEKTVTTLMLESGEEKTIED